MRTDLYTKSILTVIAGLLAILALRPLANPTRAEAQNSQPDVYIEPGFTSLRKPDGTAQLPGKLVVDRRTGDIWGFPTFMDSPYPIINTSTDPPVSRPIYLGKFEFSRMK